MKSEIMKPIKAIALAGIFATLLSSANAQQHVIANKDNTHPEQSQQQYAVARVFLFSAVQMNGYNEIRWSATSEQDTRRYIVEYSTDGLHYQTAGEVIPNNGTYLLKHTILDPRTFLYRLRIEKKDGRFVNTPSYWMEGAITPSVILYPTIIENNTVNLVMGMPVQRIAVIATDGREIFTKQMGGLTGSTQVVIPSIGRGNYFMVFYGNGWKSSEKFIVAR